METATQATNSALWTVISTSPLYASVLAATVLGVIAIFAFVLVFKRHEQARLREQNELEQGYAAELQSLKSQLEHNGQLYQQQSLQAEHKIEDLRQSQQAQQDKFQQQLAQYQDKLFESERRLGESQQQAIQLEQSQEQLAALKLQLEELQLKYSDLQVKHESVQASVAQERRGFEEKLSLLENAEAKLNTQFENLANKIFEQKSEKFTKTSESGINQILSPLKQQIDDFKRQVSEQYSREGQERASLKTEILGLKELNKQITEEAAALTNALKGDNKQQGNWGELVLERILSESGLRKGHEYEVQKSVSNEDGKRYQPDVIIHLPNDKDIVIDSKVSLIAHERVVNAEDKDARLRAVKEHVASIKGHIKGLSKKDYQDLEGVTSLDYVLMFIPIESAFMNAIEAEPELIKLALDNQIMLVSPTNLLVALRTINNIWAYENQNQNAKTIAEKAARMYDKFANFITDMEKIGKNLGTLQGSYEGAMNKLHSGKGNLLRQAEAFKSLGVNPTKQIDKKYLDEEAPEPLEQSKSPSKKEVAISEKEAE